MQPYSKDASSNSSENKEDNLNIEDKFVVDDLIEKEIKEQINETAEKESQIAQSDKEQEEQEEQEASRRARRARRANKRRFRKMLM